MKIRLAAIALVASVVGAHAADMASAPSAPPAYRPPPAPLVYNWTGFYIGAMGGYGTSSTSGVDFKGGFAGGTAGFNWQVSNLVVGIEGEGAWSEIGQTVTVGLISVSDRIQSFESINARVGFAVDNILLYGKGGFAAGQNRLGASFLGFSGSETRTHIGWDAGGGLEVGFLQNWSVKGEYLYTHYQSENYLTSTFAGGVPSGALDVHTGKIGVNYRFGGPVVARY